MADQIKTLLALDDAELSAKLGYTKKLEGFKEDLMEADKLTSDARKKVEDRLESMFTPNIWPDELHHVVESAKRKASGKTTPESVLEGCCEPCSDMD